MRALVLLSIVVAAACAPSDPPSRKPDITGEVTRIADLGGVLTIMVEAVPSEVSGTPKASLRVDGSTWIFVARLPGVSEQRRGTASDLRLGARVAGWFDGPVAASYPVQGKARAILILDPVATSSR